MLGISRNYFAPELADSMQQEVVRFTQLRRTGQTIDGNIAEYDLIRRRAGSEVGRRAGFPEMPVAILLAQNAWLSRREESLALASSQKSLEFADAAANMRRLIGSCGGAGAQGVLVTMGADGCRGAIEIGGRE